MRKITFALVLALVSVSLALAQRADNYPPTASRTVTIDETNLPIVFINTGHKTIHRNSRITARMKIIHNGDGKKNYGDTVRYDKQTVDYDGWVALKYRGNSSFTGSDKKPLSIKTIDNTLENGGTKLKVKILGMGKDKDWAMIAPFCDKTMIRDVLAFDLGRPYFDYTPHTRFCEVVLDGIYYGIYIMAEKPGKGKHRLDLNDPGEDGGDLTGDFHVEIDRPDEAGYYTSRYHPYGRNGAVNNSRSIIYQYDDPKYEDFKELPSGTRAAINKAIDDMETSFTTNNYTDPATGYRHYIDTQSFIDYLLSTEFAFNIDGYRLSTHMYKYSDTRAKNEGLDNRWKATLWDFNLSFGNANYSYGSTTNLWVYDFNKREDNEYLVPFWWSKLLADPAFVSELRDRWKEYRLGAYSDEHVNAAIDSLTTMLTSGGAMERNERAWKMFGRYVSPCAYTGSSYEDEIRYMKSWITKRIVFLDNMLRPHDDSFVTEPMPMAAGMCNKDIVVEATPSSSHMTMAVDSWRTFYSASVREAGGLPADGRVNSTAGVRYQLADYAADNAVALSQGEFKMIKFAEPKAVGSVYMLATSTGGASTARVTLVYADGTPSETQDISVRDWSVSNPVGDEAYSGLGYISTSDDALSDRYRYCLFETCIFPDNDKKVAGITVSCTGGGNLYIMGFSRVVPLSETGIDNVTLPSAPTITGYYTVGGVRLMQPQRGVNIVRYSDGSSRKILVR